VTGGASNCSLVTGGASKYSLVTGEPASTSISTCAMAGKETIMTDGRNIIAKSNLFKLLPPFPIIHHGASSALLMSENILNRLLLLG
jgi:hypothetical protein